MHMNKSKKLLPMLRFPQYKSEWEISKFNFEFLQTNSFSRAEMNEDKGSVRNIHYGDILTKYNCILKNISNIPFINEGINLSRFNEACYLQNGDIIIADTAEDLSAGKAIEVQNINSAVLAGQHTFLCRPQNNFAPCYMGYYINSPSYHNSLVPLLTGIKVYSISKANIKKTYLLWPKEYSEQQKIADCLSSLDDLIDAESRKLEALKKHKMGLTQKLFPAEGKTMPEWRFPEFSKKGNWNRVPLSCICRMQAGKHISASEIIDKEKDGTFPCYGGNGLRGYTNIFNHAGQYPLIGRQGALCGNVTFATGKFYATEHAIVVTANESIDKKWLYYLLISLRLNQYATGQAQPGLGVQTIEKVIVSYPSDEKEQQKIASCLSEVDSLITAQSDKIKSLKTHKRGLMQGLFPSLGEAEL